MERSIFNICVELARGWMMGGVGFILILLGFSSFAQEPISIDAALDKIHGEKDINTRVSHAQDIAKAIEVLTEEDIDSLSCQSIGKLVDALGVEIPPVRAQLARVAGAIGPRAGAALPVLRKALDDELSPPGIGPFEPLPSWDDSKVYRSAIEKIEGPAKAQEGCG
ncbi:hypothetical protein [Pseudoxanthomonas beigongshangi]|uniref:hypothetical protein n=1 Tax=Pseudoxanthomonas beigongshangi TaxID=2782537 RepID=UPI00193AF2FC|nr:hypothetical protein [Pseudoxanthomonas beigongshangi]